jgi:hypothetical protein
MIHELSDSATGNLSVVIPASWWFGSELPGQSGLCISKLRGSSRF